MRGMELILTEDQLKTVFGLPDEAEIIKVWSAKCPWIKDITFAIANVGYEIPKGATPHTVLVLDSEDLLQSNLYKKIIDYSKSPFQTSEHQELPPIKYYPFQDLRIDFSDLARHIVKTMENNTHLSKSSLIGLVADHLREKINQSQY